MALLQTCSCPLVCGRVGAPKSFGSGNPSRISSFPLSHSPGPSPRLVTRCHSEAPHVEDAINRAACPTVKSYIDPSAFSAVDLRVGLVTNAKPVIDPEMSEKRGKETNSRRYLQLTVDIGCEIRTIVSECKYVMDVEDAVGKKVIVVANIPECEVLGIRSHGLILTGFNYDPTPMPRSFKLILPGLGRLPPGSQIGEAAIPN